MDSIQHTLDREDEDMGAEPIEPIITLKMSSSISLIMARMIREGEDTLAEAEEEGGVGEGVGEGVAVMRAKTAMIKKTFENACHNCVFICVSFTVYH